MITRRNFMAAAILAGGMPALARARTDKKYRWTADRLATLSRELVRLETASRGRLGVALLDTASGQAAGHRGDERFLMLSSFKTLAAAYILARADRGEDQLTRRIPITEADLQEHAPVTRLHVGPQGMTLAELCEATITTSDNTAANLMHRSYGGPQALTRYIRSLGDTVTRHDRYEPELNRPHAGAPLDSTSPNAMNGTLNALLFGAALKPASQQLLRSWLLANTTGGKRLRAGFPPDWKVGEKTGTYSKVGANDAGYAQAPGGAPILVCAYLETTAVPMPERDGIIAEVGRLAAALG
ncbi:class A beta-lactamase [Achromobacter denitrificans]|uniref:beta-lactamase n=1 Tax=Achromobacter denitrificans TaxID=32002 RepID=A0ABZ3G058_ACHDE|nr:class A beta-lactamase [Achromobacter denitrificans]MDF3861921.1 class A beta-lactamase [Achromobacter denitrificans]